MNSFPGLFIDTSIWIEFFNHNTHKGIIEAGLISNSHYSCGIILIELMQGASSKKEVESIKAFFDGLKILEIDMRIYEQCGRLQFDLRKRGITIPLTDALIGTLCLTYDLPIFTQDKHFSLIPKLGIFEGVKYKIR